MTILNKPGSRATSSDEQYGTNLEAINPRTEILYSGYISRAFYFGEFGELTIFAKSKLAKIKVIQFI